MSPATCWTRTDYKHLQSRCNRAIFPIITIHGQSQFHCLNESIVNPVWPAQRSRPMKRDMRFRTRKATDRCGCGAQSCLLHNWGLNTVPMRSWAGGFSVPPTSFLIGFLMFAGALLFQLSTLPVEFNASRRAKSQLEEMGFSTQEDQEGAHKVLRAAAMTYVAGAATAMGKLLVILLFAGRSLYRKLLATPK